MLRGKVCCLDMGNAIVCIAGCQNVGWQALKLVAGGGRSLNPRVVMTTNLTISPRTTRAHPIIQGSNVPCEKVMFSVVSVHY